MTVARQLALVYYTMAASTGVEVANFNLAYLCEENHVCDCLLTGSSPEAHLARMVFSVRVRVRVRVRVLGRSREVRFWTRPLLTFSHR